MKNLYEYMSESWTKYDEKRHTVRLDFHDFSNEGDNNLLKEIKKDCPNLIDPDDENFKTQMLTIEYKTGTLTLVMTNFVSMEAKNPPESLTFKYKVNGDIEKDFMAKNREFKADDFKSTSMPAYLTKIDSQVSNKIRHEIPFMLALIMNRQPEPLW